MARDSFNEQKNKNVYSTKKKSTKKDKKKTTKTVVKKPQSSSVSKETTQQQRINQKTYAQPTKPAYKNNKAKTAQKQQTVENNTRPTQTAQRSNRPAVANTSRDMMAQRQKPRAGVETALQQKRDPLGINNKQTVQERYNRNNPATAKQRKDQEEKRTAVTSRNASEWNAVKNKSKEDQQAWFTKKATEAQERHAAENNRKVDKGTDNLATSAVKAAYHSGKGAVHSLAGALERSSMNDFYEGARIKYDAMRKGMSEEEAEKYGNEKAKRRQEARLAGLGQKAKIEQEKAEAIKGQEAAKDSGPVPLRKWTVGAAMLTGQRLVDTTLMGPYSAISMGARVLEDKLNSGKEKADKLKKRLMDTGQFTQEELDEEFDKLDKRTVADAYATMGIELLSEGMFAGVGLPKKYLPEGASGLLDRAASKLARRFGSTALGRVALGIGEETAEEWIANPVQAAVSNRLTGNRMQSLQEESIRRAYQGQAKDLKEIQATAADINSDAFLERAKSIYKESGASDEEAAQIAELARDYFNADITGDSKTAEEKLNQITDILAGGENDMREKWTLNDALEVAGEMILSVGAEAAPGAISTAHTGSQYKANYGIDGVRKLAKVVENLDEEKSERAKAIIDDIDSGKDISNTQVAMLMEWSNNAALKAQDREITRDQLVQRKMRDEKLFVPIVDAEYNLAPATEERFEAITERVADLAQEEMGFDMSDVDAYAIGDVVAAYETGTISAEQMNELNIENPENRAVFEKATGIDLGQYTVKDSRGNIKVAASNTAMQQALFAKAADNYIESARIEQENWNDVERGRAFEELTSNMDGMGGVGIQRVLESVDPRNRGDFLLAGSVARRVYEHARNTNDEWDSVKKDFTDAFGADMNESMKYVFDMAKQAKAIAETKYYGKAVNKNSLNTEDVAVAEGKFTNESARELKGTEIGVLTSVANELGINVIMTDSLDRNENGRYMPSQRTIMLNSANTMGDNLQAIFSHEVTHHLAVYAPDEYIKLSRLVMDRWYKSDADTYNAEIKRIQKLYKDAKGQDLTPEEALEELIADASHDFWSDEEFVNKVVTEEPTLAKSIINAIKDFLRKLRNMLSSGNVTDEETREGLFAEIGAWDETYRLYMNAYNAARKDQAQQAVDEWQDAANGNVAPESNDRYSITTDKEDFIKGANLSKDLRDWAKEMGLDKLSKQPIKGPVIVSVRDLRTAWYEKNGRTDEANVINTALDKIGDSLTQLVGKYQYIDLGDALNAAVTYRTDAEGNPTSVILSCQVKNAEYEVNFDFTTICAKRLAMQKILERFIKTEGERQGTTLYDELKLDEEGLYKLRLILETAGFDVSCRGCFVEQNRYSQQNQARTIANDWNAALDDWARENGTEVTENFGLTTLDIDNLDYEEIEAGFERYHELMKGKKTDVATKNRMLIEASPFFRKRMNASDYASMTGQRALMAIGESKKGGTNLYGLLKRGQSDSKQSVPFTAYNGEIALLPDNMKGKSLYDYLLSIGGARAQSASDFQIEFVYDYMQMVADLSARGLPMHMYTKVIELAELFGMTGIKINLSAMCDVAEDVGGEYAGLKLVDGKYEYNISDQSIDYEKAVELQKRDGYSKNIGIIMVTLSSQHMLKSLGDPDVRYIIGYHSSAMPVVVANMSNMGGATDYTKINKTNKLNEKGQALFDEAMAEAKGNTELEKYKDALRIFDEKIQEETAKKKKKPRRGNEYGAYMSAYGNNTADFNTYDSLLETKDARKTADKYLEHCMENDLIPIYFPFAFHENYYKCEVYDFNMYDNNTGEYAPMESVQNIYPGLNMAAGETDTTAFTERVSEMMDERNRLNESLDSQYDAVFDEAKEELKYSITGDDYMDFDASGIDHNELTHRADAPMTAEQQRDADYMAAVNSGNMDEAQRLVDEAAKMAGYTESLYHGTGEYFNVFRLGREGIHLGNIEQAEQVARNRYHDRSRETRYKWGEIKDRISEMDTETRQSLINRLERTSAHAPIFDGDISDAESVKAYAEDALQKYYGTQTDINNKSVLMRTFDRNVGENIMRMYARLDNPFVINGDILDWTPWNIADTLLHKADGDTEYRDDFTERRIDISGSDLNLGKWTRKAVEQIANGEVKGDEAWHLLDGVLEQVGGYHGIKYLNEFEGDKSSYSYLALNRNDVKLADPVTYAEDGSVIPLSERFDPDNNDIRYSLPTQDSDGNILTDGQMEYFKNSQARDEQGRLVPVYHTTTHGGFTVFDPWYSNDHRSLFFASNWDVSQTYGRGKSKKPIRLDYSMPYFKTMDDFSKYAAEHYADMGWKPDYSFALNTDLVLFDKETYRHVRNLDLAEEWVNGKADYDKYSAVIKVPNESSGFWDSIRVQNPHDVADAINKHYSQQNGQQSGYYSCYLNLQNPMIVDAKGKLWNDISYGPEGNSLKDHLEELKESSNLLVRSVMAVQGDYDDDGVSHKIDVTIRYLKKKPQGGWYLPETYRTSVDISYTEYEDAGDASLALWSSAENALRNFGLPSEYITRLEVEHTDYDGDIVWTETERGEDIPFDYINTNTEEYEIVDRYEFDTEDTYTTRQLAELAEEQGYDGVIIKNCYDLGGRIKDGANPYSDIYIAFSSNQVKDINNENPTENPDIRYSIASKQDVLDYIAANVEDINDVPMDDPSLEQNRQEQSEWHENFVRDIISRFDEGSLTFGMYLDEDSVKNHLIALMKQVMSESGTGKKYRTDTLQSTIDSAKVMFYDMQNHQIDNAADTAWRAAQKIVDDIDYNDDLYVQYKGVRDYLDKRKIIAPEGLEYDESFAEFVRDNSGRMRFVGSTEKGTSVDTAYKYLVKKYPQLFPADMETPIDKLLQIDYALDYTTPYREAYSSEDYSKLVTTIAGDLMDIVSEGESYRTVADKLTEKYEGQIKAMRQRHQEALRKVKETEKEKRDATRQVWSNIAQRWKDKYNERIQKDKAERKAKADKREHLKSYGHIAENYNKLCTWVLKPTKQKNVPEEFRKSLADFLQTLDLQTENSKKLEAKTGRVAQKTLKMRELKDRLNELATRDGEDGTSVWEVDKSVAFLLEKLSDKLDKNGNSIDALDSEDIKTIDAFMELLIRNIERYKQVKMETKNAELSDIGGRGVEFLKAKIDRDGMYRKRKGLPGTIAEINAAALTPAYLFDRMGPLKEMYDVLRHNGFDTYIRNEKMIMDRLEEILGKYYRTNKKGQNMPGSIIEEWRDERSAQTIELANGKTVTMSIAQIMSLRCLAKRGEQAMGHMMVGGIVVKPIQTTSKLTAEEKENKGFVEKTATRAGRAVKKFVEERTKGVDESVQKYVLTYEDILNIISKLTPEQANIADKLQELMSVDMAKLGNEAHRELYGYEMFEEGDYFPIKVHGNERSTNINNIGEVIEKIKSFGFTKPLTPKAKQAIEVDDIFSIVADHCNGMNLYNAYLVPITDFMKVLNYDHTFENGETLTMKEAIVQAYGEDMLKYILNLMKDINGIKEPTRGSLERIMNNALGRAKRTAVFGNIRVAFQQLTAIVRAAAEINPKYIKGALNTDSITGFIPEHVTATMEEMWKYCPIAQWKAWGYYDTYMGRDIEDVMMNQWSVGDKVLAGYYGQLDNEGWQIIWMAVKAEQAKKYPDMDHASEEFLKICGRRASEIFDKTQVVDSTFHRSDAMRSKQIATKLFTAFMAEPTLTLNVFRAGLFNASEERKAGNHAEANKILARAISVIVVQAVFVSAAQAFADAWRGKDPGLPWDDDDDEEKVGYWWRWVHNFVYNGFDQLHLENNMYLVKDVTPYINYMISKGADYADYKLEEGGHEKASDTLDILRAIMGWDQDYLYSQNNLVFAGLENTANGIGQAFKKLEKGDEYVDYNTKEPKRWYDINQKIASGIGTFTGLPVGTLMRDFKPIWDKIIPVAFAADTELLDAVANKMGYQKAGSSSDNVASEATSKESESDKDESADNQADIEQKVADYRESLSDNFNDEEKDELVKQYEKRIKKGVKSEEVADRDKDTMLFDAEKAAAGYEGTERDKRIWQSVSQGYKSHVESGDYAYIARMRSVVEQAGGNLDYFDEQIVKASKTALKKTIEPGGADTESEMVAQQNIRYYLQGHGVTQEEISSEIVYKCAASKDLKVAFRLGDEQAITESSYPLLFAGLTTTDYEKIYTNRNRMDLSKYDGKYKDRLKSTGTFVWPTQGTITSHFGARNAPTRGASSNHPAIDIGAPKGTPVVAADGGVVIYAGSNGGYGNSVGIKHDNGWVTYYNHLSGWNVQVGDTVAQGQQIAAVGSTGISTGPHLDFKVLDTNNKPVDPEKYLNSKYF